MATESVATRPDTEAGSSHDLWIGGGNVLTIQLDKDCKQFPPTSNHCADLSNMIQGLARAAKSVVFQAENDMTETTFLMQPVEDIANAIILLSQLSEAVRSELEGQQK